MVVRARFISGRMPITSNQYVYYVCVSLIYHGLAFTLLGATILEEPSRWWLLGYLIVLPALFGGVLGVTVRWNGPRKWLSKFGINLVHPVETAWDWKFASANPQWILVTLKDGTNFGGWLGEDSFVSSRPLERDLYVETLYTLTDGGGTWTKKEHSIYVPHAQIKTIECWPASDSMFPVSQTSEVPDATAQQAIEQ